MAPFSLALLMLILPFMIVVTSSVKIVVRLWAFLTGQDFRGTVDSGSTIFLQDKIYKRPHSTIVFCMKVKGDAQSVRDTIVNRITEVYRRVDPKSGKRPYLRIAYYPVNFWGFGFWKRVDNFLIKNHINVISRETELIPGYTEEQCVARLVEKLYMQVPFQPGKPMWHGSVFSWKACTGKNEEESLLVFRFHHSLGDGLSLVKLLHLLMGTKFEYPRASFTVSQTEPRSWFAICWDTFVTNTIGPFRDSYHAMFTKDLNIVHCNSTGEFKMTGQWVVSIGPKIPLESLKAISRQADAKVHHLLYASLTAAVLKYIVKYFGIQNLPPKGRFLSVLPLPHHPNGMCNYWTMSYVGTKFGMERQKDRISFFKTSFENSMRSWQPFLTKMVFQFVSGLVPTVIADILSTNKGSGTMVVSNVPGPQQKGYLGEHQVEDIFFFLPISKKILGLGAGFFSYAGTTRVCLTADLGCIQTREQLDYIQQMVTDSLLQDVEDN